MRVALTFHRQGFLRSSLLPQNDQSSTVFGYFYFRIIGKMRQREKSQAGWLFSGCGPLAQLTVEALVPDDAVSGCDGPCLRPGGPPAAGARAGARALQQQQQQQQLAGRGAPRLGYARRRPRRWLELERGRLLSFNCFWIKLSLLCDKLHPLMPKAS